MTEEIEKRIKAKFLVDKRFQTKVFSDILDKMPGEQSRELFSAVCGDASMEIQNALWDVNFIWDISSAPYGRGVLGSEDLGSGVVKIATRTTISKMNNTHRLSDKDIIRFRALHDTSSGVYHNNISLENLEPVSIGRNFINFIIDNNLYEEDKGLPIDCRYISKKEDTNTISLIENEIAKHEASIADLKDKKEYYCRRIAFLEKYKKDAIPSSEFMKYCIDNYSPENAIDVISFVLSKDGQYFIDLLNNDTKGKALYDTSIDELKEKIEHCIDEI